MTTTALALDPHCLAHNMGPHHPESPERLAALRTLIQGEAVTPMNLLRLDAQRADAEAITRIHTSPYFERIAATDGRTVSLDPDTTTCPASFDTALRAAGSTLAATEAVLRGDARNAFALVRPPGHHAEPFRAMGFCLFNSVAIAAAQARAVHGLERIAIVDFDVHHGNGTQRAFYEDPAVLYISTHQAPYYPGTGAGHEVGRAGAEGSTLNLPLRAGEGDATYGTIYESVLPRVLEQFEPELVLVSAGFDLMANDPLGGMEVSVEGVRRIAAGLVGAAERLCAGRTVFLLEGGYDLPSLTDGVRTCLEVLQKPPAGDRPLPAVDAGALGSARNQMPILETYFQF